MEARGRCSASGLPPAPPSQPRGQWHFGAGASPLTAAGPSRTRTGFPDRSPEGRSLPLVADASLPPALALGSGRPLGGGDLRALVGPPPRNGSRGVGHDPAHVGARD